MPQPAEGDHLLRPLVAIQRECQEQDRRWGAQRSLTPAHWYVIASEEHGEVATEIVEMIASKTPEEYLAHLRGCRHEAVQTAAVYAQMVEGLDRLIANEEDSG